MYFHKIALLLTLFMAIQAGAERNMCPSKGIKPIKFPPEYLLGVWRTTYCTDSAFCRANCAHYPYKREENDNIFLYFYGYDESETLQEDGVKVEFTDQPGVYRTGVWYVARSVEFYMLHTREHFCVLYGCITDMKNVTRAAAWISTKDDRKNELESWEIAETLYVLKKNGLNAEAFRHAPYIGCEEIDRITEDADLSQNYRYK